MCSETRSEVVLSKLVVVHAQGEITNLKVVGFFLSSWCCFNIHFSKSAAENDTISLLKEKNLWKPEMRREPHQF